MDNVIMLSEIHPRVMDGVFNPLTQAEKWYHLFRQDDLSQIRKNNDISWIKAIELIHRRTQQAGKRLLVRDWSHIDYTGVPWVDNPFYRLTTAEVLSKYFHINSTCTVRHPVDQWLSLEKLAVIQGKLDIRTFLKGYRAFAEKAAEIGFLRYEDFTSSPDNSLQLLCNRLGLDYDGSYTDKWYVYTNITGDTARTGSGRGTQKKEILTLRRRTPERQIQQQFRSNPDYAAAIRILGYED